MPYLLVHKRGFASLYGMLILSIILFFISLITSRITTFTNIQKHTLSDIFVLHHINTTITHLESDNNENDDELPEDSENTEEISFHEIVNYKGCDIPIEYDQNMAKASVICKNENYELNVQYDIKTNSILSYEYNGRMLEE